MIETSKKLLTKRRRASFSARKAAPNPVFISNFFQETKKGWLIFLMKFLQVGKSVLAVRAGVSQPKGNPAQVPLTIHSGTFILTRVW